MEWLKTHARSSAFVLVYGVAACGSSDPLATAPTPDGFDRDDAEARGLPPNGPDVLYLPRPDIPQLQNRDARFNASPLMISGTERYIEGEYQYTDFIYDDDATTYPDGSDPTSALWERYGGNSADLFEFRMSTRDPSGLAIRFTLNTLMVPDSTIVVLAFDSDNDPGTGSSTLPRDPNMPFPGTDQALTTWGTGAEWSKWNGASWDTEGLDVRHDIEANQITVTVPQAIADPHGQWKATLAVGLFDPSNGGWLPLSSSTPVELPVGAPSAPRIVNLGFRFDEVASAPPRTESAPASPATGQDAALADGEPTRYSNLIDFDLLRSGGARDNVPERGMMYRIFPSRMDTVLRSTDGNPTKGNPMLLGEGKDITSLHGRLLSPLQPYALYVPSGYDPREPAPLTFWLHPDSGSYYWLNEDSSFAPQLLGEGRQSIVLSPGARGISGYYVGHLEFDVFEAWADVARHYTLDPIRVALSGYSMGAYGSYHLGLLNPHLFGAIAPIAVPMCRGLWLIAQCSTTEDTVLARWTESARNLPVFHLADSLGETTFFPGQAQAVIGQPLADFQSLESLGYRYTFWALVVDHIAIGNNYPQIAEFFDQHPRDPEPFHVTYARMPATDLPEVGLLHNRAYWLSGIEVRDASGPVAKGVIDAVSLGFGKSDPTSTQSSGVGVSAGGWPYVETQRSWSAPGEVPVENRIVISATNIASITIDPSAARVDCDVALEIESDGPIDVKLLGCSK